MSKIQRSVDLEVPVQTAYEQWSRFEEFPRFMEGVSEVRRLDDTSLHWVAEIYGAHREWDAKITELVPNQRLGWTSTSGPTHAGIVTFHPMGESASRVVLEMEFDPEDFVEKTGDVLGLVKARVGGNLERFKEFIERPSA